MIYSIFLGELFIVSSFFVEESFLLVLGEVFFDDSSYNLAFFLFVGLKLE